MLLSGGCDDSETNDVDDPYLENIETAEEEDQLLFDDFMRRQAKRRWAYENLGVEPTVPSQYSSDPQDPFFEFLGYADFASQEEFSRWMDEHWREVPDEYLPAYEAQVGTETELREKYRPYRVNEPFGLYLAADGEMWMRRASPELVALMKRERRQGPVAEGFLPEGALVEEEGDFESPPTRENRSILGSDQRVVRSAENGYNMRAFPFRAIGGLNARGEATNPNPRTNRGRPFCTATKIGSRHLLSAAHCLILSNGSVRATEWWPAQDGLDLELDAGAGDASRNPIRNVLWWVIKPQYWGSSTVWGQNANDVAVGVLADQPSVCNIGAFWLRENWTYAGDKPTQWGYPNPNYPCKNSPTGFCEGSMWGSGGKVARTALYLGYVYHDWQSGHSGAAVYAKDGGRRYVESIVNGPYNSVENMVTILRGKNMDFVRGVRSDHPSESCQ